MSLINELNFIRGLSFFAEGEWFAADVTLVQKMARKMEVTPVLTAPDEVVGIANIKGKVVTILSVTSLLGRKRNAGAQSGWPERGTRTVNAVIFKPPTESGDQMGLAIDRPGGLIALPENTTAFSVLTDGTPHISGVYESDGILYRVINIDSIISRFRDGGPEQRGGTVNEENL